MRRSHSRQLLSPAWPWLSPLTLQLNIVPCTILVQYTQPLYNVTCTKGLDLHNTTLYALLLYHFVYTMWPAVPYTLCLTVHRSCPLKCSENTQKCSTDLGSCTIACFNHVISFSGQIRINGIQSSPFYIIMNKDKFALQGRPKERKEREY